MKKFIKKELIIDTITAGLDRLTRADLGLSEVGYERWKKMCKKYREVDYNLIIKEV